MIEKVREVFIHLHREFLGLGYAEQERFRRILNVVPAYIVVIYGLNNSDCRESEVLPYV